MHLALARLESPLGPLVLAASEVGLCALEFADSDDAVRGRLLKVHPNVRFEADSRVDKIASRVLAYFSGDRRALENLPIDVTGTPFQKTVWATLREIPMGTTISYRELARRIGNAAASRAVGGANSKNPVALVVPCHRVIAADGTLGGYAGGLWRKSWLLQHESNSEIS